MSHLILVTKDGEVLSVHPDALDAHRRLGWALTVPPKGEQIERLEPQAGTGTGVQMSAGEPPAEPVRSALDHDADGEPGGSLPAADRGLDDLHAEAESLGIKIDKRWGEGRLRDEIAKAKA